MKVDEIITERIIELLESGTIPWKKPWSPGEIPQNAISRRPYRGINPFILNCSEFSRPYFLTYKQAKDLGGTVRKGEKGIPVVFWKVTEREIENTDTGETEIEKSFILRYYTVFNVAQTDGIDWEKKLPEIEQVDPIAEAEAALDNYVELPSIVETTGNKASYTPSLDRIRIPHKGQFQSPPFFYATLFHEITHSTGHESRLNRKIKNGFADENYSKEELVAEMGSALMCGRTGIDAEGMIENSAAYIANWLEALKNDKRLVICAAAQAQKAVDYVMGNGNGDEPR